MSFRGIAALDSSESRRNIEQASYSNYGSPNVAAAQNMFQQIQMSPSNKVNGYSQMNGYPQTNGYPQYAQMNNMPTGSAMLNRPPNGGMVSYPSTRSMNAGGMINPSSKSINASPQQPTTPYHYHQQNKLLQQQEYYLQQRNMNDGDSVTLPSIFNTNGIAAGGSVASSRKGNGAPHSSIFMPDLIDGPLKVKILAISVVELPSIHTFMSNSPTCSIACGKYSAGTSVREGGGSNASWDQLDFAFPFDKNSTLRALVTSKEKTIGFVNISRVKLINGKKSKNGPMVVSNS